MIDKVEERVVITEVNQKTLKILKDEEDRRKNNLLKLKNDFKIGNMNIIL